MVTGSLHLDPTEGLSDETQAGPSTATSTDDQLGNKGEQPFSDDQIGASEDGSISDQLGDRGEKTLLSPELVEVQIESSPTTNSGANSSTDLIDLTEACDPCSEADVYESSSTDAERPPEEYLAAGRGER